MRTIVFLFFLWSGIAPLTAQVESSVTTGFDVALSYDTLYLGNMLKVEFCLNNLDGEDFTAPAFAEWRLLGGPSTSTQMNMMNGRIDRRTCYAYYLDTETPGYFRIEPASVIVDGEWLLTEPQEVIVLPNPTEIRQDPEGADSFDEFQHPFFSDDFFDSFGWPDQLRIQPDSLRQPRRKRITKRI